MNRYTFHVTIIESGQGYTKTISARSLPVALRKVLDGMFPPRLRKDAYIDWLGDPQYTVFSGRKQFATIRLDQPHA